MSDNHDYLGGSNRTRLTGEVTLLMLKGAGYALVFCLCVWFVFAAMAAIGRALPEESRDTPDPNVRGAVEIVQPVAIAVT